jgi:hypothetical protein
MRGRGRDVLWDEDALIFEERMRVEAQIAEENFGLDDI